MGHPARPVFQRLPLKTSNPVEDGAQFQHRSKHARGGIELQDYQTPLADMQFVLSELIDMESVLALYPDSGLTADLVDSVLTEAARLAEGVMSPADETGKSGVQWKDGAVITPPGYRDAYSQFVEGGWHSLSCRPEYGGQGFPRAISAIVDEMWRGSNLALNGCMTLTRGAIEAIELRGSDALKSTYLPKLIRGDWTGSMNLTEPQAGSDLSAIRTRAEPQPDGSYRLFGQKIFISWGRHDLTDNVVHLVLARTPDAPEGVKGISLFLVPQQFPDADGNAGERNDVHCAAIEKKIGQHGSPTCVMLYGSGEYPVGGQNGAVGYLVGDLNRGLEIMFIMMNEARFGVGLEGLAGSERALQTARAYARERIQGSEVGGTPGVKVPIIRHPDVRRMLMRMKSATEGMRALSAVLAAAIDRMHASADAADREDARGFVDLMTPIFKGWNTEVAVEVATMGVQMHGGMGFMDECTASQHYRDVRIMPIYEGTTAIQANDLVGRKIARDKGASTMRLAEAIRTTASELNAVPGLASIGGTLSSAAQAIEEVVAFILDNYDSNPREVLGVAVPILQLFWLASVGWQLGRSALAANRRLSRSADDVAFLKTKIITAHFFAEHWMPAIDGLLGEVRNGSSSLLQIPDDQF
jgi:alkylation response protein AidB-like acyl-CoA dehydrogenase